MACCKGEAAMVSFCARVILVSLSKLDHLELTSTARVLRREKAYGTASVEPPRVRLMQPGSEKRGVVAFSSSPSRARAQGWASARPRCGMAPPPPPSVAALQAPPSVLLLASATLLPVVLLACSADISAATATRPEGGGQPEEEAQVLSMAQP